MSQEILYFCKIKQPKKGVQNVQNRPDQTKVDPVAALHANDSSSLIEQKRQSLEQRTQDVYNSIDAYVLSVFYSRLSKMHITDAERKAAQEGFDAERRIIPS